MFMTPICICGRIIRISKGKNGRRCPACGVKWIRDKTGFWAIGLNTVAFTPKANWLKKQKRLRRGGDTYGPKAKEPAGAGTPNGLTKK